MDPFASHPIRALLALLRPNLFPANQRASTLRSKRSAAYKARQGPMKSVFASERNDATAAARTTPEKFEELAGRFVRVLREYLGANEVRALATSSVASPVLQVRSLPCSFNLSLQLFVDVAGD
jgi:nucleolar protein 9